MSDGLATFSCGDSDWSAKIGENGCPDDLKGQEVLFLCLIRSFPRRRCVSLFSVKMAATMPFVYQSFDRLDSMASTTLSRLERLIPDTFMVNFTTQFLGTRGGTIEHFAGCDCSASGVPAFDINGEPNYPTLGKGLRAI